MTLEELEESRLAPGEEQDAQEDPRTPLSPSAPKLLKASITSIEITESSSQSGVTVTISGAVHTHDTQLSWENYKVSVWKDPDRNNELVSPEEQAEPRATFLERQQNASVPVPVRVLGCDFWTFGEFDLSDDEYRAMMYEKPLYLRCEHTGVNDDFNDDLGDSEYVVEFELGETRIAAASGLLICLVCHAGALLPSTVSHQLASFELCVFRDWQTTIFGGTSEEKSLRERAKQVADKLPHSHTFTLMIGDRIKKHQH